MLHYCSHVLSIVIVIATLICLSMESSFHIFEFTMTVALFSSTQLAIIVAIESRS